MGEIGKDTFVGLLQDDIQHYDGLVRDYMSRIQQLLLLIFTVAGIASTLLYGYHQYVVLLALPVVGCITLFVGANITGEMLALAAYKYCLEQTLFKVLHDGLPSDLRDLAPPPWDSTGGRIRRRSVSYIAIQGAYILTLVIVSIITIIIAWQKMGRYWWLAPVVAAVTVILMVLALWSYVEAILAYEATLFAFKAASSCVSGNQSTSGKTDGDDAGRYDLRRILELLRGGTNDDWHVWQQTSTD